jgi:hypothetical protein
LKIFQDLDARSKRKDILERTLKRGKTSDVVLWSMEEMIVILTGKRLL